MRLHRGHWQLTQPEAEGRSDTCLTPVWSTLCLSASLIISLTNMQKMGAISCLSRKLKASHFSEAVNRGFIMLFYEGHQSFENLCRVFHWWLQRLKMNTNRTLLNTIFFSYKVFWTKNSTCIPILSFSSVRFCVRMRCCAVMWRLRRVSWAPLWIPSKLSGALS